MSRVWLGLLLVGCARSPRALSLRDPRIDDDQRAWLVDAQDEVAIARARVDDATRGEASQREHQAALLARMRAAGVDAGPWQAVGRARREVAQREHRRAEVRLQHAEARLALVYAEVAMGADLAVYQIEPLRAEVARLRDRLAEVTRDVERASAEAEDRADEAWASWRGHLGADVTGVAAFWKDLDTDAVADGAVEE